jgi:predicted outer membrane repeat protein
MGAEPAPERGPDDSSWYVLNEPIQDFGSGNNTVEFRDCYVDVDSNTYEGKTTWSFTNATIDMDYEDDWRNRPPDSQSTRTITFTNLLTTNTYLNTIVVMVSTEAQGSTLMAINEDAASPPPQMIKLGVVAVGELNGEMGHIETYTVQLLDGNIQFEPDGMNYLATMAYEYLITIDSDNPQNIIVDAYKVSGPESLNDMNKKQGDRALMFMFDSTTNTYQPGSDLDPMNTGIFFVKGNDTFDGESTILAISSTTGQSVSLFRLEQAGIDFELARVTLKGASIWSTRSSINYDRPGCVCANCKEIQFISNEATGTGGGAIYVSNGAYLNLDGTKFIENNAAGNGGAMAIEGSSVTLYDVLEVTGNSSQGNGGAIYINNGRLDIVLDTTSPKIFSGNTASEVSNGIYLDGTSVVNFGHTGEVAKYRCAMR